MKNDLIYTYDHISGIETIREMTDEEQTERNKNVELALLAKQKAKEEKEALRQTKINAYQKLGLTSEEIEALLPLPIANTSIDNG